jgi:hypothetical protein
LKETSYLTDTVSIAPFAGIATTIGNYLFAVNSVVFQGRVGALRRLMVAVRKDPSPGAASGDGKTEIL